MCFNSTDQNNFFFEDDPKCNEKIALPCVCRPTESFEVDTDQCCLLAYKPRNCFALLETYILFKQVCNTLTFSLAFLIPQDWAITIDSQ